MTGIKRYYASMTGAANQTKYQCPSNVISTSFFSTSIFLYFSILLFFFVVFRCLAVAKIDQYDRSKQTDPAK